MKRRIRILAMTVALISCFVFCAHAADSYVVLDGFAFDLNDQHEAVIHGYDDRACDVVIPATLLGARVAEIDGYAFFNDASITSVSFEQTTGLRLIGDCAFYGCTSLTELALPDAELSFGSFQNCSGLQTLTIADGVTEIPEQCFYCCGSLEEISLPDSVTEIGLRAFADNTALRYAYIPETVTSIAANAFDNDGQLTIRCTEGSYAAQYALAHNIPVEYRLSYTLGDADGSGAVDTVDATVIQRYDAFIDVGIPFETLMHGDVDGDDDLTVIDATFIQRYDALMETPFPIGGVVTVWYT